MNDIFAGITVVAIFTAVLMFGGCLAQNDYQNKVKRGIPIIVEEKVYQCKLTNLMTEKK